jgi:protein-disulfide isomerase
VKLVEYVSYTCPHCAAFINSSGAVLKGQMVRSGSTSIELRHYIFNRIDLAAALIARCGGAAKFAGLTDTLFAQQKTCWRAAWSSNRPMASGSACIRRRRRCARSPMAQG